MYSKWIIYWHQFEIEYVYYTNPSQLRRMNWRWLGFPFPLGLARRRATPSKHQRRKLHRWEFCRLVLLLGLGWVAKSKLYIYISISVEISYYNSETTRPSPSQKDMSRASLCLTLSHTSLGFVKINGNCAMGKVLVWALASMLVEACDLAAIRYHHRIIIVKFSFFRSRHTDDWFKSMDMLGIWANPWWWWHSEHPIIEKKNHVFGIPN